MLEIKLSFFKYHIYILGVDRTYIISKDILFLNKIYDRQVLVSRQIIIARTIQIICTSSYYLKTMISKFFTLFLLSGDHKMSNFQKF